MGNGSFNFDAIYRKQAFTFLSDASLFNMFGDDALYYFCFFGNRLKYFNIQ